MEIVNEQQARERLSALLGRVERGEHIGIARAGRPVAELCPLRATPRRFGFMQFDVPDDFDTPLADELDYWV